MDHKVTKCAFSGLGWDIGVASPCFTAPCVRAARQSLKWRAALYWRREPLSRPSVVSRREDVVDERTEGAFARQSVCEHGRRAAASKMGDHPSCLVCDCRCRGVSGRSHGRCARLAGDGWPAAPDHGLRPWRGGAAVMTDLLVGGLPCQDQSIWHESGTRVKNSPERIKARVGIISLT